jgi:hypothetical protein
VGFHGVILWYLLLSDLWDIVYINAVTNGPGGSLYTVMSAAIVRRVMSYISVSGAAAIMATFSTFLLLRRHTTDGLISLARVLVAYTEISANPF